MPLYYRYDQNGNRTRVTHPDGYFFTYQFDGVNRFTDAGSSDINSDTSSASGLLGVRYGSDGLRKHIVRPNDRDTNYFRDSAMRLEHFTQSFANPSDSYEVNFSYNPANQVVRMGQTNDQYNFREVANRTGVYQPNGLNQYSSIAGQTLSYDAKGNLTNDGYATYTYDMENRLVAVSGTVNGLAVSAALSWDTNGRLFQYTVNGASTQFLYDGDALVAEYVGGALMRRYMHGDQVDEPLVQYNGAGLGLADRRFLFADHQGSIIAHANNSGALLNKLAYDPYGISAAANIDRFGYTGQAWLKELGLYHYKARMYHPKLGRFLQIDPIYYVDDMNLYAYVAACTAAPMAPLSPART